MPTGTPIRTRTKDRFTLRMLGTFVLASVLVAGLQAFVAFTAGADQVERAVVERRFSELEAVAAYAQGAFERPEGEDP